MAWLKFTSASIRLMRSRNSVPCATSTLLLLGYSERREVPSWNFHFVVIALLRQVARLAAAVRAAAILIERDQCVPDSEKIVFCS